MKISLVAIAAAAVLLSGCVSTLKKLNEPKLDYREYAGEPVKSFDLRNYDGGWSAVSRDQLVVWSGINQAYLIKVAGYCPDLQFANAIAVTNTAGTVDKFEKIIVGRDRCLIEEIRPVDTKQMKEDRKLMKEQREQSES
jgi:lipocalin